MEPGSPALATGPTPSRLPQGQRRSARDGEPAPACCSSCSGRSEPKSASSPDASPQVDLELLGQDSNSSSPPQSGQHDGRALRAPGRQARSVPCGGRGDRGPRRCACPALPVPPSGRLWRTGRPGAFRTADSASSRSSSATRASRSQGAPHARPSGRSAPGARRCWLEKPAKLSDLSDQLLVGVGFSAEDVMRAGIPNNTFRVCSGGGPAIQVPSVLTSALRLLSSSGLVTGTLRSSICPQKGYIGADLRI